MSDRITTVAQLRAMVRRFVDDRDWQQFHSPKNLSMALSIEAAELMEHFQWLTNEKSRTIRHDAERLQSVTEELADVVCYALALANELDVDLTEAMRAKMRKNEEKYPVESYRGRYGPEDDGQ